MNIILEKLAAELPHLQIDVENIVKNSPENIEKYLLSLVGTNPLIGIAIHTAISAISTYTSDLLKSQLALSVVSDGVVRIIIEDENIESTL